MRSLTHASSLSAHRRLFELILHDAAVKVPGNAGTGGGVASTLAVSRQSRR